MDYGRFKMLEVAQDFLRDILADGKRPAKEIYEEGISFGLSERTLDRAKAELGIVSKRDGKTWVWGLP